MAMAAILIMWPGPFEQTFVPPSQGGSTWNVVSIGSVVSEEKMFENVQNTHAYIRTTEAYLSYKLTTEPLGSGELKMALFSNSYTSRWLSLDEPIWINWPHTSMNVDWSYDVDSGPTKFVQIMILSWPWPTLQQGQLCSLMILYGKMLKY